MLKFGTDGVRGVANAELTPELTLALGRAAARVLGGQRFGIGRDTRRSGPMLEAALAAGLASEGVDVTLLGVAPTPEVAWWSASEGVPAAVVSASHNPFTDNGIKLFAAGGRKLPDEVEERLEAELHALVGDSDQPAQPPRPGPGTAVAATAAAAGPPGDTPRSSTGSALGVVARTEVHDGYRAAIVGTLEGRRLDGLRVVVDCANGAATVVAPAVLRQLGAQVKVIHATPDGSNINDACGSTHPETLRRTVVEHDADVGIAFDGDADRVLLVDGNGQLVDGDQIIAVCAIDRHARGALPHDTVVVTVMANLGLRQALAQRGIRLVDTSVGDRYVLEALEAGGFSLGGEQSGHIIFRDLATTGDGLLTAIQTLDVMVRMGRPLAEVAAAAMTRLPQVLRNVEVERRDPDIARRLAVDIAAVESRLGEHGRVLVRLSGTEPLVRVMVEAPTGDEAVAAADELVHAVETLTGSTPRRSP